jgi:hypothetical protein
MSESEKKAIKVLAVDASKDFADLIRSSLFRSVGETVEFSPVTVSMKPSTNLRQIPSILSCWGRLLPVAGA